MPVTVKQILVTLKPVKPMSRETLYAHIRANKIKPLGKRQCPQLYPDDTTARILKPLGLATIKPTKSVRNGNGKARRS